jgi:hypothetical protein
MPEAGFGSQAAMSANDPVSTVQNWKYWQGGPRYSILVEGNSIPHEK